jgi:hypothetical protein
LMYAKCQLAMGDFKIPLLVKIGCCPSVSRKTEASIANKLARATVSAHFYLASVVALGKEEVTLEDI